MSSIIESRTFGFKVSHRLSHGTTIVIYLNYFNIVRYSIPNSSLDTILDDNDLSAVNDDALNISMATAEKEFT